MLKYFRSLFAVYVGLIVCILIILLSIPIVPIFLLFIDIEDDTY